MTSTYGELTLSYTLGTLSQSITFGSITDLNIQYNKSVLTTPIVTRSYKDTFAIESASAISISASFTRTKDDEDETGMNNAVWDANLVMALDRWQARSDGFTLKYEPATGTISNPYTPAFEYNGYVKQMETKYEKGKTQYITGSMTFEVGTMIVRT